jgi:RNA polymerase sigma factor (sigma-70 family)
VSERSGAEATLEGRVRRAQRGDRSALESVVKEIQPQLYGLALRFLWHPEDAQDATQEILIRIVTKLGSFRGESGFRTWAFQVACNALRTLRRQRMERPEMSLEGFAADLATGLSDQPVATTPPVEEALLWEEVKIGCTTAMLLCLDREHRLAYILGEILELDHRTAAAALEVSPDAYRQRLARARGGIVGLMKARCGLAHPENPCRCRRRVATAMARGHLDPARLLWARSAEQARRFPQVLDEIRRLEELQRAAALQRSHLLPPPSEGFVQWLRALMAGVARDGPLTR